LNQLTDEVAVKVFYDSYEKALLDAKRVNIIGIIEFPSTYSNTMAESLNNNINQSRKARSKISVTMDQTNHQVTLFLQKGLRDVFLNYSENMLTSCGLPRNLNSFPIKFLEPIYGDFNADYKQSMAPSMVLSMTFFTICGLTIVVIMSDRKEGFWNRTILAGVTTSEILFAHIIIQSVILIFQVIEIVLIVGLVIPLHNQGSYFLVIMMLALEGWSGLFLGLFLSCFCPNFTAANSVMAGLTQPITVLSGSF
jgi:ABC-type multidrug transport system permease subunit